MTSVSIHRTARHVFMGENPQQIDPVKHEGDGTPPLLVRLIPSLPPFGGRFISGKV